MRSLPLRLAPVDGESLSGYVTRYSHTFRLPPGDVVRALGLDGGGGTVVAAGRYGVWLPPDRLEHAALAVGIPTEVLERMLLCRYAGRAFEALARVDAAVEEAAQGHEVMIRSSKFCPRCLRENGAWLVRWQLGWSAICAHHRALLARVCPRCQTVPKAAAREMWPVDRRGVLSDPSCCARRQRRRLCRVQLAAAATPSVSDEALAAQLRIDTLLDGGSPPPLAGELLAPLTYLRCLHALCKLVHHAQPSSRATGRRLFDDPAAVARVLPTALRLADLPEQTSLADAMRKLVNRRYQHDGSTYRLSKLGDVPDPLRIAVRHALSTTIWAPPASRMGLHPRAHRRPDNLDERLEVRHVPQLFWAEDYHRELAALFNFDDFTHWLGRRFCSVLLVRMLAPLDWRTAVRYLDFPEAFNNDGYNTTFAKLRTNGRFEDLAGRVKRIANQHARDGLIDYKQRRGRLADWDGIDIESWHLLQPHPRPLYPHRRVDMPVRRAHASVWLWCQLTNGHERAAPVALPTRNLAHHTYFIRDVLPGLRERLSLLGELLLATPANARQTLPTRLAAALQAHGHLASNYQLDSVDPLIVERVLAHTSAHTGVDIPSLTTPSHQSHAPPAITHARLLAAALLRTTALASRSAIASAIGGDANHIGDNDRSYRAALQRNPRFATELELLARAVHNWQKPAPTPPSQPHRERMQYIAKTIRLHSAQLLALSHGADIARRTSIAICREHTDLTCNDIAAIHDITAAQPAFARETIAKHRATDPDYEHRYQQLTNHAQELQHAAGFANANLTRGLTSKPRISRPAGPGSNYTSNGKVA